VHAKITTYGVFLPLLPVSSQQQYHQHLLLLLLPLSVSLRQLYWGCLPVGRHGGQKERRRFIMERHIGQVEWGADSEIRAWDDDTLPV
jgi:hypothetical protein